ncbi:MAG TPA: response regulator, partial [Pyrinomonadaceae bacterium]|nr:response regulator [Pyrinomonadaceae bacterium]
TPTGGAPSEERARLLVVDDEESVALTIGAVLQQEGFEVDTASSGSEAAERLREKAYDLVLTDLHMEGGDGLSVLEAVRRHSPLTISIVLTGFASVETAIAALRQDAYDYLVKPCIIDELKYTVRRGLDHRRLLLSEQEARASLEQLNRELERRVEERTLELQRVNDELVAANRAKDIFLATLSHELRTPLTPVLGWVNLLRSSKTHDPAMLRQALEAIERNARLQARLVDDLLDISRVVSGKLRLEREPVDLRDVVATAVETARADADARDIALEVETPETPVVVQGSPVRLQQVAWNLLSNAVKFTPTGGRVRARLWSEGGEARVSVEDTGVGIAPEFLPHVFDRFRQADSSTTRQHGGLGLGLAIVRALTELHGGWVRAESEGQGRGARFTFGLPRAADGEERAEEGGETRLELSRPVLVVEDSPEILHMLHALFTRHNCAVLAASTADEALKLAASHPPAVVVSDLSMPDADGHELLARLRELPGMKSVPAVALSGYATEEDRRRALQAGFAVHLAKPVDPDRLFAVIRQLTAKR